MVFCVVTEGELNEHLSLPDCDIALFNFSGLGEVDYESELKGVTEKLDTGARLSKRSGAGLICGCTTLSRGALRRSAAVYEHGKLLGISDMNYVLDGEEYKSGGSVGFYKVNGCKIGICLENDLLFPDVIKSLATCGCSAVVALMEQLKDTVPTLLIRSYAYLYGIPIIMCAGKSAFYADSSGEIASSRQKTALFEIAPQNNYRLVTTRLKGITPDDRCDY